MATTLKSGHAPQGTTSARIATRPSLAARHGIGRAVLETVALVAIAVLLISAPFISRANARHFETGTVLTAPGDTLWTIASKHPIPGLPTAQAVDVIAKLNALEGARLPAGTVLQVPSAPQNAAFAMR